MLQQMNTIWLLGTELDFLFVPDESELEVCSHWTKLKAEKWHYLNSLHL
jgi:hypothetical protein